MFQNKFNKVSALVLVLLALALLIGLRFGATWSGGDGYVEHEQAFLHHIEDSEAFNRGEIISTMEGSELVERYGLPLGLHLGDSLIFIDENTEVKLVDGRPGQHEISVIQGRVVVDGELTISTRETKTHINGLTSFVHYSWEDRIEVANLEGTTSLATPDQETDLSSSSVSAMTLPPYSMEDIPFDPVNSSAADFYDTALQ